MIKYKYDLVVFICKGQPPHKTHIDAVSNLLLQTAENVLVLFTSANSPRTVRTPFSDTERQEMFEESLIEQGVANDILYGEFARVHFDFIADSLYDEQGWADTVLDKASKFPAFNIALMGYPTIENKPHFIELCDEWDFIPVDNPRNITGKKIRPLLFDHDKIEDLRGELLKSVYHATYSHINRFMKSVEYQQLLSEYPVLSKPRSSIYPLCTFTVAVQVQVGTTVLLRQRSDKTHGNGLWGFPYRRIKNDKMTIASSLREVINDLNLTDQLPTRPTVTIYDHPERNAGVRTMLAVYKYELNDFPEHLDPNKNNWFSCINIDELRPLLFEDTADILTVQSK
jgi:bifunctional NMN adenylyltransferase/nudix hydrolase